MSIRRHYHAAVLCCASIAAIHALISRAAEAQIPSSTGARQGDDAVGRLAIQIENGEVRLEYQPGAWGYLPSLLAHLGIHADSQVLVFAKNSFQAAKISPANPRAIFFSDTAFVGFVPGGEVLELIGLDSRKGLVFYTLRTRESEQPRIVSRQNGCAGCHAVRDPVVPGLLIRSVFPGPDGTPIFMGAGAQAITDDRTPFDQRWGGWYVTGTHGSQHHLGNAFVLDASNPAALETVATQNLTRLNEKFDTSKYMVPTSDIVALLTLEHQSQMVNFITEVNRLYHAESTQVNGKSSTGRDLDSAIEDLVTYMLFAEEVPLTAPVRGVSTFTQSFPQGAPRDRKGRSLRDFNLRERLFQYPLSYMIYSDYFATIPEAVRGRIYRRLYEILTGEDRSKKFARLSTADRRAVVEILRDTKSDLPASWKER